MKFYIQRIVGPRPRPLDQPERKIQFWPPILDLLLHEDDGLAEDYPLPIHQYPGCGKHTLSQTVAKPLIRRFHQSRCIEKRLKIAEMAEDQRKAAIPLDLAEGSARSREGTKKGVVKKVHFDAGPGEEVPGHEVVWKIKEKLIPRTRPRRLPKEVRNLEDLESKDLRALVRVEYICIDEDCFCLVADRFASQEQHDSSVAQKRASLRRFLPRFGFFGGSYLTDFCHLVQDAPNYVCTSSICPCENLPCATKAEHDLMVRWRASTSDSKVESEEGGDVEGDLVVVPGTKDK